MTGRLFVAVLAALAVAAGLLGMPAPSTAQTGERITEYHVAIEIEPDGDLLILETIRYDFGTDQRRGIFRDIPVRLRYDDRYDRLYRLDVLGVETSQGTPGQYVVEDIEGGRKRIRIGDPDRTITGAHEYRIRYRIGGAMNAFPTHDELYWNAIGADWAVPIERASGYVAAPADVQQTACFAGPSGSTLSCADVSAERNVTLFEGGSLRPYEALTVVVAIPPGTIPSTDPVLEERFSLARAFTLSPLTVAGSVLVAVAAIAGITRLVWLGGRDRRWAGSPVDVAFGSPDGESQRVGLFELREQFPVEFVPPDGIKPGEIGVLIDEVAHPVDVTATIVDLAVHGHLRIEEVEAEGFLARFAKPDWRLVRLDRPADGLEAYERLLLDGLFEDGDEVLLSSLKTKFVARLNKVQEALYEAVVAHGWFPRSPKSTRERWLGLGAVVLALGAAVQGAAIAFTHLALIPVALPLAGVALMGTSNLMPHRTPKGTAALVRVRGFRRFIEEADREQARFAENANLFYDYLPYAVVFGATEKWAKAFEGLSRQPQSPAWYASTRPFAVAAFADSMGSFAVTSAGTIASTPGGSGSSGFSGGSSGGGGGGGGGGSW